MHVKKGDEVVVIAGNDKGKTGTVQSVLRGKSRVIVEGVNMRWKHQKPTQQSPQGERIRLELSIHSSNVQLLDKSTGKGTRKRPGQDR